MAGIVLQPVKMASVFMSKLQLPQPLTCISHKQRPSA